MAKHRGMDGRAICQALRHNKISVDDGSVDCQGSILLAGRKELDLLDTTAANRWIKGHKPEVVVLAATKVWEILVNISNPADFLLENIKIQCNVIEAAWRFGVHRLSF